MSELSHAFNNRWDAWVESKVRSESQSDNCQELAPGKSWTVFDTPRTSPTGLTRKYRVHRTSPTDYEIELPIVWGNTQSWNIWPRNESESKLQKLIETCTDKQSLILKGPKNENVFLKPMFGWSLMIHDRILLSQEIQIHRESRSSVDSYKETIDCGEIVHELLHRTGLVDEYKEEIFKAPNSSTGLAYDCRHTTRAPSIMQDAEWALYQLQKTYQNCEVHYKLNGAELGTWVRLDGYNEDRPLQGEELQRIVKEKAIARIMRSNPTSQKNQIEISKMICKVPPKPKSPIVLFPAHFRMITKPFCKTQNQNYLNCAADAYRTSGPSLDGRVYTCQSKPECTDSRWLY